MPFHIERNYLTRMRVDAIVNAANPSLLGGGGVDGAIHRAAGPRLLRACRKLGGCETSQAKLTKGYDLPAKNVIHTVGPVWCGGERNEEALLAACYRNSLTLALEHGCNSVAFPLISAGAYGVPKDLALAVAVREIGRFLLEHELDVTLVVFDADSYRLSSVLFSAVQAYVDERFVEAAPQRNEASLLHQKQMAMDAMVGAALPTPPQKPRRAREKAFCAAAEECAAPSLLPDSAQSLDDRLRSLDESFSQMLLRKIDEKGMTDAACYKKANVDRKLFSKIRSDPHYRPSKQTAIAFAIALELPLDEAKDLLMKAGFALSRSNRFDVIIEYFISSGNYNIFEINETLFAFDQSLLGA